MSILYLINPYSTAPDGEITDVITSLGNPVDVTGSMPVRVPDGVPLEDTPEDVTALLDDKYDGLLALYAGFSDIVADACMSALTVNVADPASTRILVSSGYNNHCILPGGVLVTVDAGPLGVPPTVVIVVWETYRLNTSDPIGTD